MSNNIPGSSGNDESLSSESTGLSGASISFDPGEVLQSRRNLRKRRVQNGNNHTSWVIS